jgi:hypothetical protein
VAGLSDIAAILFCIVISALTVFQAALVAGAPLGHFAWGGADRVLPAGKRVGSAVSIVLYAVFAAIVLDRAGLTRLPLEAIRQWAIWALVASFALGIAVNAISRSRPERLTMTPVAAVLCACCLAVALG